MRSSHIIVNNAPQNRGMSASLRRLVARHAAQVFAVSTLFAFGAAANAATFNYTGGGTGTAAAPVSGSFSTGFSPAVTGSTNADTLSFAGTTYTATDDLASQITANVLTFTNSGAVTVARGGAGTSNSILLTGTTPAINLNNAGALTFALDIAMGANLTTAGTGAGPSTFSGILSGAFSLTKTSPGTLTLTGANTYSGGTTISSGILNINSDAALGAVPGTAATNLTFTVTASTLQAGATTVLNANRNISIANTKTPTFDTLGNTLTINGSISGGTFIKAGTGRLILAGTNAFPAGTAITFSGEGTNNTNNDGQIQLASNGALGTNAITIGGTNETGTAVAAVELIGGVSIGSNVTINTGGRSILTTQASLRNVSGNNTFGGTLNINNSGGGYPIDIASGTLTLSGTLKATTTGNRGFSFLNGGNALITGSYVDGAGVTNLNLGVASGSSFSGTVTLAGTDTYTGGTTIYQGTLQVGNAGTLGSLGTGAVVNSGTLKFNRTNPLALANVISGAGTVNQIGTGTTTLSGANTYTGATNITAGGLTVTGSLGATAITATGGTFNVQPGSGTKSAASLTLNAGSAFSMVDTGIGIFNLTGGLTFGTASGTAPVFTFDIGNAAAGPDKLVAAGAATAVGAGGTITINRLSTASTLTPGDYNLITAASGLGTGFNLNTMSLTVGTTVYSFSLANSTATNEILTVTATGSTGVYYTGSQDNNLSTINAGNTNFATDHTGATNTGVLPGAASDVFFTADTANNLTTVLGGDLTYNSVTFTGTGTAATAGVTIGGANTLTLNAGTGFGINVQAGSGANTISANVALGSSQLWTNNASNALTVSGNVTGAFALTTGGSGTIVLSGTGNTYSGGTTVTQGTLTGTTAGAFGTGNVTVLSTSLTSSASDNATLNTNGSIASTAAVTVSNEASDGGFGLGTINFNGATPTIGSLAGNGSVVLNSAGGTSLTTGGSNTGTTFSGVISDGAGSGSVTKTGTGTFVLSGLNTYSGTTTVSGGTVTANTLANGGSPSSIGQSTNAAGNLVLNGGTLSYTGAAVSTDRLFTLGASGGGISSNGTGPLTVANVGAVVMAGSGARTLTLGTGGTSRGGIFTPIITDGTGGATSVALSGSYGWVLNGVNTYTGGTSVVQTVGIGNASALGTGTLTTGTANVFLAAIGGDQTIANNFTYTGNRLVIEDGGQGLFPTGQTFGNLTINGNFVMNGAAPGDLFLRKNLTVNGVVSGSNNGIGILFSGNPGTLTLTNAANTFTGNIRWGVNPTTATSPGVASTLNVNSDGAMGAAANTLAFNTGSNGATLQAAASFTTARAVSIVTAVTANIDTQTNTLTETGIISGAGAIAKKGTGVLVLTGANTFTGGTTVSAGALSGPTQAYSTGGVTVAAAATADYTQNTASTYAASITGNGSVTINANPSGTLSPGGTITYTGQDSAAGGTTVKAGTLLLSRTAGSGAAVTGPVSAATSGTIGLGGNDQIAPSSKVGLLGAGILAANGHNEGAGVKDGTTLPTQGVGTLQIGSPTDIATATLDFGDAAGTANGGLGNVLAFADSSSLTWNGTLNVTNYTSAVDQLYVGSTGSGLTPTQLGMITFNGVGGATQLSNGEVVMAAAPEPSGWVSLLSGAGVLGGIIARKRRAMRNEAAEAVIAV